MSAAAATVSVVTTGGPAGQAGVTVSAMTSVSADGEAPTLLVCVHHLASAAPAIVANGCFCVNVLRDDQSHISDAFAGRTRPPGGDRFAVAEWVPMPSGAPRVRDPLTAFDCRVKSSERVGTHHVFIGEVGEIFLGSSGSPLIYANRAYGSPVRLATARPAPAGERLRIGALHTFGPLLVPGIIRTLEEEIGPVDLELQEGDQRVLLDLLRQDAIDIAFLYDLGLDPGIAVTTLADLAPYVLLPEGHPLAGQERLHLAELLGERLVLLDAPPSAGYFLSLFAGIGTPRIGYRARSFEMVRGLVAHGLGYALLATKPASSMSYDGKALVTRALADPVPTSRLVLSRRRDAPLSRAAETFLWHCRALFSPDLD
jgi:flavin reductase (DIM6/NTAB) family NADH-FMN oxidoreductase RutF